MQEYMPGEANPVKSREVWHEHEHPGEPPPFPLAEVFTHSARIPRTQVRTTVYYQRNIVTSCEDFLSHWGGQHTIVVFVSVSVFVYLWIYGCL